MPDRIRLSSGETRTGGNYTKEELEDAGYLYRPMPDLNENEMASWNYKTGDWEILEKNDSDRLLETAQLWIEVREKRNKLLADSDWTQLSDSFSTYKNTAGMIRAWKEYRLQLKNITKNFNDPRDIVWPTEPTDEDFIRCRNPDFSDKRISNQRNAMRNKLNNSKI